MIQRYWLFGFILVLHSTFVYGHKILNVDAFLNATFYSNPVLSPNGQLVLFVAKNPSWETDRFINGLWLCQTNSPKNKYMIEENISESIQPQWSPSGDRFIYSVKHEENKVATEKSHHLKVFDIKSRKTLTIDIGEETPLSLTWSNRDNMLYLATLANKSETNDGKIWKGTIQYRQSISNDRTNIHRIDINEKRDRVTAELAKITTINFLISNIAYASAQRKLVITSAVRFAEELDTLEVYELSLRNVSSLKRLSFNGGVELNLKISSDGRHAFFNVYSIAWKNERYKATQARLYSVDLETSIVQRWASNYQGNINGYALRAEGGILFLGQDGVNVGIYSQKSPTDPTVLESRLLGTYGSLSTSYTSGRSSIAFTYSAYDQPQEIYFARQINQLSQATRLTDSNQYLKQFDLPRATTYKWKNKDDDLPIEGILHYPPGKWQAKNLPLLVLIHGGPASASLNMFQADWYSWAPLAASQGWLVLEPNYRGSIGYGDEFTDSIRFEISKKPGNDILDGVDKLVAEGIADQTQLTVGGFSYGGYMTNWLITQTTRFNAALSGAGAVDQIGSWGTNDIPIYISELLGGYPWEIPKRYFNESALFQLDKVLTPTHIVTGAEDIRVPIAQSVILERGLQALGIPSQLLLFPGEGHDLANNPWYGKIKLREELEWLEKYGHKKFLRTKK